MNRRTLFWAFLLVGMGLFGAGCSEQNAPDADFGTVIVAASPDSLAAEWSLLGPGNATGSGVGDSTLSQVAIGEYTITWADISGWNTPAANPETKTLGKDATITFTGEYTSGSIVIDPNPDDLDAAWHLAGPDEYSLDGAGDLTLPAVVPGEYTLTWSTVAGYLEPSQNPVTTTLAAAEQITFAHTFVAETDPVGQVTIDVTPDQCPATWTLTGPAKVTHTGTGDSTFVDLGLGLYTVAWDDLAGWTTPDPATDSGTLTEGAELVLTGAYIQHTGTIGISGSPAGVVASWSLAGPGGSILTGSGDQTLTDMVIGEYTIIWLIVDGYRLPDPLTETATLSMDQTLELTGGYAAEVGTLIVDIVPNGAEAPWILTGPADYSHNGFGDQTLADMALGEYTITWDEASGWVTPDPDNETVTLDFEETITLTGSYTIVPSTMTHFAPGTFLMGSAIVESGHEDDETRHYVSLTHGILVGTFEVTNQQYADLAQWAFDQGHITATATSVIDNLDGSTEELLDLDGPGCQIVFSDGTFSLAEASHANRPVAEVSWYGAVAYCDWLSLQDDLPRAYDHGDWSCGGGDLYSATGYRLLTESEWEYTCRAGILSPFNSGICLDTDIDANYRGNFTAYGACPLGGFLNRTTDIGSYLANDGGLFDMHGNVNEWCADWYEAEYPAGTEGSPAVDPTGPATPPEFENRVIRGGSFYSVAKLCRSAVRDQAAPSGSSPYVGFRIARTAD